MHSLIIDGVCAGVGSVLSFLPIIVLLFFFLSLLEDSGYMARVAFVMDKLLRKIGLSGRSFVPMLIGFGCSVPAIMATRTLSSERDRKMTIVLTPFMSCSAKLPIYGMITAAFFPDHAALVMIVAVCAGHCGCDPVGAAAEKHRLPRQSGALCHGAARLPPARRQERAAPHVGKGQGLFAQGLHHHLYGLDRHLVFAEL